ncbi:MAG TPA: glycerophosphodiester phosphodiesterase family protein [Mycobacteriales bacterium]|nr:glycerophosphodiester phosphodiesterase family protein [Mycobacteriales bacterium]
MPPRYPFLDAPLPLAFAHRGADTVVENSMAAFESVRRLGYRYVETDVRATADGVLLAFHDATLDRVTDRTGRISRLPYAEVARARIGGTEPIPPLADVLGELPELRLNLDVKEAAAVRPLVELLRRTRAVDRVCVGSFSDARVTAMRSAFGPALCTSMGRREILRLRAASYLPRSRRPAAAGCVQVPPRVGPVPVADRRLVATAHGLGLQVHVWTVNDAAEMNRLLDLGVDGIMTDQAELLRDVLRTRGRWHA